MPDRSTAHDLADKRAAIATLYRADEHTVLASLAPAARVTSDERTHIALRARELIVAVREQAQHSTGIEQFLQEYL